jgi:DNA polymerase V
MSESPNTHGGKRPGAGRKSGSGRSEPTAVMRVPASQTGTIRDFIAALNRKRLHEAQDNVVELFRLSSADETVALPLFTTKVAAGFPSPADDHVEQRLNPNSYLVQNEDATFCLRVKGDSMIDAGIFDNDVLIIDRSRVAQVGDIVLAVLDGEFTVKTLGKSKVGARLIPANKNYPVIEVKEEQYFEVWGVVTGSMRKFK